MGRYASDDDLAEVAEAIADAEAEVESDAPTPEEPEPEEGDEGTPEGEDDVGAEPDESEQEPEDQQTDKAEEPTFTVRIDGQDVEVPQSELVKGYMRTADYTRKTQLLGNQRRQLEDASQLLQALERNPEATLKVLARHYAVSDYEPDEEGPSPEQVRLMELEQWRQGELARQREAAVNSELDRLHRDYGDFDEESLFGYAVEHNVADLETALRAMTFGQAAAARRTEKRKTAAVAGGQGRNGIAHPKQPPEKINVFQDAYQAAKRELEMGN
jgi:hypothetical protein